jgi:hypothetical protein
VSEPEQPRVFFLSWVPSPGEGAPLSRRFMLAVGLDLVPPLHVYSIVALTLVSQFARMGLKPVKNQRDRKKATLLTRAPLSNCGAQKANASK